MNKKQKLIFGGMGIVIIGLAIALILTQCSGANPSSSSSSSSSLPSSSSSSSSASSSSSESSSASSSSSSSSQAAVHTVLFQNYDGAPIQSLEVEEGATIVPPAVIPTRDGFADLSYTFIGYSDYTDNMVVGTSDMTFTANYATYSNAIVFINNGLSAAFHNLSGFSSNRLIIPVAIDNVMVTQIDETACINQLMIDTVVIPPSITSIRANAFFGCDSITQVFFQGSATAWQAIVIEAGNGPLTDHVLFYSETATVQGWHYVGEVPTAWEVPTLLTTTLNPANAPVLASDAFGGGTAFVDGFQINYYQAKSLVGEHACLSGMSGGSIYNDASTPITSIAAITVTFPTYGGSVTLETGGSADTLGPSQVLTSGVRVEFQSSPSFFGVSAGPDFSAMDPWNSGAAITSIVIEYTNIPVPSYPVYTLAEDGASYILSSYSGVVVDVVIPTFYNGLPVTEVGAYAFQSCETLTNISLPDTITKIGDYAFQGCPVLTGFDLPANLISIGNWAFSGCPAITYMHLPASLESIGEFCFAYSGAIAEITFAEGIKLTTLTTYAFIYCAFTTIRIPEGITTTGFDIFQSIPELTTVYLPVSLTTIGDSTFNQCPNIADIYYAGSETQWNAITKYANFTYDIGAAVIHFAA